MKGKSEVSNQVDDLSKEINDCKFMFLQQIEEQGDNSLRLVVVEGIVRGETVSHEVGGVQLSGHPVEPSPHSRIYEITWNKYVAYAKDSEDDQPTSSARFCEFSKSSFLRYVSESTFANDEYPGPLKHFAIGCENHIVDVVSVGDPTIRSLSPAPRSN
jgi:hypothetical protein